MRVPSKMLLAPVEAAARSPEKVTVPMACLVMAPLPARMIPESIEPLRRSLVPALVKVPVPVMLPIWPPAAPSCARQALRK